MVSGVEPARRRQQVAEFVDLDPLGHRVRRYVQHLSYSVWLVLSQQFHEFRHARKLSRGRALQLFGFYLLEIGQHHTNTHQKNPITANSAQPSMTR